MAVRPLSSPFFALLIMMLFHGLRYSSFFLIMKVEEPGSLQDPDKLVAKVSTKLSSPIPIGPAVCLQQQCVPCPLRIQN